MKKLIPSLFFAVLIFQSIHPAKAGTLANEATLLRQLNSVIHQPQHDEDDLSYLERNYFPLFRTYSDSNLTPDGIATMFMNVNKQYDKRNLIHISPVIRASILIKLDTLVPELIRAILPFDAYEAEAAISSFKHLQIVNQLAGN